MVKRPETAPASVTYNLRLTDRTLGSVIESVIGVPPALDVVAQWRPEPPHPTWVSPPFASDAPILARATGYRHDGAELSHNLAFVDLSTVEPEVAEGLQSGSLNLGQLFLDPGIERYGFEWGEDTDAPALAAEYERLLAGRVSDLRPAAWRRYVAGIGGTVTFLVIEALPRRTWERVFATPAERG
jgi:hypothetical protein